MLVVKGLTENDTIFDCANFKKSKGKCRSGAPKEGVKKGEPCPFDDDQYLCSNYEK